MSKVQLFVVGEMLNSCGKLWCCQLLRSFRNLHIELCHLSPFSCSCGTGNNLRSGVLFFGGARKCGSARVGGREKGEKNNAWYNNCTSRLPLVQILDFCLIGRKTKDSLTHVPIGYMIAFLTFGVISKLWWPSREMWTANFSLLLLRLLKTSSTNRLRMNRQNASEGLFA